MKSCKRCGCEITSIAYKRWDGFCSSCYRDKPRALYFDDKNANFPYSYSQVEGIVLSNINLLDKVLWAGILTIIYILISKLGLIDKLPILGVELHTSLGLVIIIILTIAHLYVTFLTLKSVKKAWIYLSVEERIDLFRKIQTSSGILIKEIKKRKKSVVNNKWYFSLSDSALWISVICLMLLLIALLPLNIDFSIWTTLNVFFSILIVGFNWHIGSHWAIAISELSDNVETSKYFNRIQEKGDVVKLSATITFWINEKGAGPFEVRFHYILAPIILLMQIIAFITRIFIILLFVLFWGLLYVLSFGKIKFQ